MKDTSSGGDFHLQNKGSFVWREPGFGTTVKRYEFPHLLCRHAATASPTRVLFIGRGSPDVPVDVPLKNNYISRTHATVTLHLDGSVLLNNVSVGNPVMLNGAGVPDCGDELTFFFTRGPDEPLVVLR